MGLPGVTLETIPPSGAPANPAGTGTVGKIGRFQKGDIGVPVRCGTKEQAIDLFGPAIPGSAMYGVVDAFDSHAPAVVVVRIDDTDATVSIVDRATPTPAAKMSLTAKICGTQHNYAAGPPMLGVRAVVAAGTQTETFKLTLTYGYKEWDDATAGFIAKTFVEEWDNLSIDDAAARYFPTIINASSTLVVCVDLAPTTHVWPTNAPALGNHDLAGGLEPEYVGAGAIDEFEKNADINFVLADTDTSPVRAALVAHCNKMGDRIAIFNPPQGTTLAEVEAIGDAYDEEFAVTPWPWQSMYDPVMGVNRCRRPAPGVAGTMASLAPEVSICNKKPELLLAPERALTEAELLDAQTHKIMPLYYFDNRGIRLRNGINMSSDPNTQQVFRTRMQFYVGESLRDSSGWAVGGQIKPNETKAVQSLASAFLAGLLDAERIEGYSVVKVDSAAYRSARKEVFRVTVRLYQVRDELVWQLEVGPDAVVVTAAA